HHTCRISSQEQPTARCNIYVSCAHKFVGDSIVRIKFQLPALNSCSSGYVQRTVAGNLCTTGFINNKRIHGETAKPGNVAISASETLQLKMAKILYATIYKGTASIIFDAACSKSVIAINQYWY